MAKANTSKMIEQHVEKAVAGFCGLILLYAIFHWGVSSSDEITISTYPGNAQVSCTPGQLDGVMAQQADLVRKAIDGAKSNVANVPDYAAVVKTGLASPMPNALASLTLYGSPSQPIGVVKEDRSFTPTLTELTDGVVAPSSPKIISRRVLVRLGQPEDRNVVNGVSVFSYGQVLGVWTEKLKAARISPAIIAVSQDVERQEKGAGGTWGNAEIVKLDPKPRMDTQNKALVPPNIPSFDGSNYLIVQQAVDEYKSLEWQQQILQPSYPEIFWAAQRQWVDWRVLLPSTEVNLPDAVPAVGSGAAAPAAAIPEPGDGGAAPVSPATPKPPVVAGDTHAAKIYPLPPLDKQREAGKVNVQFSDQTPQAGKVYRYRVRLKLVNPLLTMSGDVKNKADATTPYILTPWSDWSGDVLVPNLAEFFVTGGSDTQGKVQITIFSVTHGQVVRQTVNVTSGQPIGKPENVNVIDPETGKASPIKVDFSTGCVVVDVNFNKPIFRSMTAKTNEIIYLDANGVLKWRLQELDKNSKLYLDLENQYRASVIK